MNATSRWLNLATAVLVLGLALAVPAGAELADVYLKNGLALRGEVQLTETEVVLRNVLGEVRIPRAAVARVVAVGAAPLPVPLQPADVPATETLPAPEDKDAEAHEGAEAEVEADADAPATELPLPLLSALDIQRVRMSELRLDGPAENVRVDFGSAAAHDRLVGEVLERLRQDPDLDALWRTKLLEGTPAEQLQVIAALTGTEYCGRVQIGSDPEVVATFRQRIWPLVLQSCGRLGCHSGPKAHVFRLPTSAQRGDSHMYTAFVILNTLETVHGPLINRDDPEGSLLVSYMLPSDATTRPHGPVPGKRRVTAVLPNRRVPGYDALVEWIDSLRTPYRGYGLDYRVPQAGDTRPR